MPARSFVLAARLPGAVGGWIANFSRGLPQEVERSSFALPGKNEVPKFNACFEALETRVARPGSRQDGVVDLQSFLDTAPKAQRGRSEGCEWLAARCTEKAGLCTALARCCRSWTFACDCFRSRIWPESGATAGISVIVYGTVTVYIQYK